MNNIQYILILALALAIPLLEISRRLLVIRVLKSMFPDNKLKPPSPLFDITYEEVPYTKEGKKFIKFYKIIARVGFAIALACLFGIWLVGNWRNL